MVAYSYNRNLLGNEKEQRAETHGWISKHAERNLEYIMCDSIYMKF